jgi:hypothetical protein
MSSIFTIDVKRKRSCSMEITRSKLLVSNSQMRFHSINIPLTAFGACKKGVFWTMASDQLNI